MTGPDNTAQVDTDNLGSMRWPIKKCKDHLGDISLTKAILRKYMKENCSSELYLQLSSKYFVNLCFIQNLFLKL